MSSKSEKKNYVLLKDDYSDTNHIFRSRQPRGAALKATTKLCKKKENCKKTIRLRERGTKTVHVYRGHRVKLKNPTEWQRVNNIKLVSKVKKLGVEHL